MGHPVSDESREKMSKSQTGKKMPKDVKDKIFVVGDDGKYHMPEETNKKLSDAHMGHIVSEETRKKISDASKGRTHTEKAKAKISKARKGKKQERSIKEESLGIKGCQ